MIPNEYEGSPEQAPAEAPKPPKKKGFDLERATRRYHAVAALDPDVGATPEEQNRAMMALDPEERQLVINASKDPGYKDALYARIAEEEMARGVRGGIAELDDTDFEDGEEPYKFAYKDEPPPPDNSWRETAVPPPAVSFWEGSNEGFEGGLPPRPTAEAAFGMGILEGPTLGWAGEIADALPGVEGVSAESDRMDQYQPEAKALGELLGGTAAAALFGRTGLPALGRSTVNLVKSLAPTTGRAVAAEAALGAGAGMGVDAAQRAGHAAPGEGAEAAAGAVPFMGGEEDPFPLGFAMGGLGSALAGGGEAAQRALRNNPEVGHTLQHLESLGGSTDAFSVAKPRPGVSMAPVAVDRPALKLDDMMADPGPPLPKPVPRVMTAEEGVAANLAGPLQEEAADMIRRTEQRLAEETESFLKSDTGQIKTVPANTARLVVEELTSGSPFAAEGALKKPLRAMVEKVVPVRARGAMGEPLSPPDVTPGRFITVKRGQLKALGLDDMVDDPKPPSSGPTTVRPPKMGKKKPDSGLMGTPDEVERGPLGEPLAARPGARADEPGAAPGPTPRSAPDFDPEEEVRLVLKVTDARGIEKMIRDIDDDVDWKTRSKGQARFAAAARADRNIYGPRYAALKERHHQILSELEEGRVGMGLGRKEFVDPGSGDQRGKIERHVAKRGNRREDEAAFQLASTPKTRQGLKDLEAMRDVRTLTAGSHPGRLDEGFTPMSVGTLTSMRLRADPAMGFMAEQGGKLPVQLGIPALSIRDIAGMPDLAPNAIMGLLSEAAAERQAAAEQAAAEEKAKRIAEQVEALRLSQTPGEPQ